MTNEQQPIQQEISPILGNQESVSNTNEYSQPKFKLPTGINSTPLIYGPDDNVKDILLGGLTISQINAQGSVTRPPEKP